VLEYYTTAWRRKRESKSARRRDGMKWREERMKKTRREGDQKRHDSKEEEN
jgi:hypothetical protein